MPSPQYRHAPRLYLQPSGGPMTATFKPDWRDIMGPRGGARATSRERARRAAVLVGSVAAHALVLGLIGVGLLETRRETVVDDRAVYVEMEPRP
ncbi:MAG: hypothetical protein EBR82_44830, partial [Caulobacteraceae bacterium]|nr:hypothetical protein [Caulobacteraceae bacterium]